MSYVYVSETDSQQEVETVEGTEEVFYPAEEGLEGETPRRSARRRESVNYNYNARRKRKSSMSPPNKEDNRAKASKMQDLPPGGPLIHRSPQVRRTSQAGQPGAEQSQSPQVNAPVPNTSVPSTSKAQGSGDDMLARMEAMFAGLSNSMQTKFDGLSSNLGGEIRSVAEGLDHRIGKVSSDLENLRENMDKRSSKIEKRLVHLEQSGTGLTRDDRAYWEARRSLRINPIKGPDLRESLREFLVRRLDLDPSIMERIPARGIRKLPSRQGVRYGQEAVIAFDCAADRDMVKSSGFKLAGDKDSSIRLEIPSHLMSLHRVLSSAAQRLRSAKSNCRTNIRFDDETKELVLDYKIKDEPWARLRGSEARKITSTAAAEALQETKSEDFERLLGEGPATGANALSIGGL